jgi:hypothetical protein
LSFDITAQEGSRAADRFYIVFRPMATVPVAALLLAAQPATAGIGNTITGQLIQATAITACTIERSEDGRVFADWQMVPVQAGQVGNQDFNLRDERPFSKGTYYRAKAKSISGAVQWSDIVFVNGGASQTAIVVSPNPVEGQLLRLQLHNLAAGQWEFRLYNAKGQLVMLNTKQVTGQFEQLALPLTAGLPAGNYQLQAYSRSGVLVQQVMLRR